MSPVARAAGWSPLETVPLVQAIVPLPKDMAPDTARVWFVPQDTPYFYWLIPESPDARRAWHQLARRAPKRGTCTSNDFLEKKKLEPLEFQGARIPVYTRWMPVRRQVGQRFGLSGGRRRGASESHDGGWNRHGIARRARRCGGHFERRRRAASCDRCAGSWICICCCGARCTIFSRLITAGWWIC